MYKDGDNAHWNTNPQDYAIDTLEVTTETTLNITMAEGGGFAISLMEK